MAVAEFLYRMDAGARGAMPGSHRSPGGDRGMEFRAHASLLDAPDPRRLDLLASLRDPLALESGRWLVRVYKQRKAIPVALVADLSASMGVQAAQRRLDTLADLTESLARSAWRLGDSFAFIGCDEQLRKVPQLAPTRARAAGTLLAQTLRGFEAQGRSAQALTQAWQRLGSQRHLVFLVSDFHLDEALIRASLRSLQGHDVVPVVLWDTLEWGPAADASQAAMQPTAQPTAQPATQRALPPAGPSTPAPALAGPGAWFSALTQNLPRLLPVRDAETGQERLVWWRPALRQRWQAAGAQRRAALSALFQAHQRRPVFVEGEFRADQMTRHFAA